MSLLSSFAKKSRSNTAIKIVAEVQLARYFSTLQEGRFVGATQGLTIDFVRLKLKLPEYWQSAE